MERRVFVEPSDSRGTSRTCVKSASSHYLGRKNLRLTKIKRLFVSYFLLISRPEIRQGDPPNLSILISGGKENNRDALSNGE